MGIYGTAPGAFALACVLRNTARMNDTASPAAAVLDLFRAAGWSARRLARALDVNTTSVTRWMYPRPAGSGGLIPPHYHVPLLDLSREIGAGVTPDVLVLGRPR